MTTSRDGIEQSLLRVNELIDAAIEEHRRRSARPPAEMVRGLADPVPVARELAAAARRTIGLAVSDATDAAALAPAGGGRGTGRGTAAVRILCPPRLAAGVRDAARHRPGSELRVSRGPVRGALLVDGEVALVRRAPGTGDPVASVIRSRVLVPALEALFGGAWAHAAPVAAPARPAGRGPVGGLPPDLARRILGQLCSGTTDIQAARRLGISLRTYRRGVASLMQDLGAESRFQAGALAVEAGLLPASA